MSSVSEAVNADKYNKKTATAGANDKQTTQYTYSAETSNCHPSSSKQCASIAVMS